MNRFFNAAILLAILSPLSANAATYLCVVEAAAIVEDGGNRPATAGVAKLARDKYLLTRGDAGWRVRELGMDYDLFDKCSTNDLDPPAVCEKSGDSYAGTFVFFKDQRFTFTGMMLTNGRDQLIAAKGRCSKVQL